MSQQTESRFHTIKKEGQMPDNLGQAAGQPKRTTEKQRQAAGQPKRTTEKQRQAAGQPKRTTEKQRQAAGQSKPTTEKQKQLTEKQKRPTIEQNGPEALPWSDLRSMTLEELTWVLTARGEKKFRAKQIYGWLHQKLIRSPEEMRNVPVKCLEPLLASHPLLGVTELERYESKIDGTMKFLFALHDGNLIESVLMKYKHGNSVCISSQAGCRMGCRFCASTLLGLSRNLYPSEMLDQIYAIQRITGERVSHVVVMGTGEPFDNFEALSRMIDLLCNPDGLNIGHRNITVSTCGIVPRIYEFADRHSQITLAISLHAPNDAMRGQMMPIANRYSIGELMEAAAYYVQTTGRRITFEYSLVKDKNDGEDQAMELVRLVRGLNCHINLIPVNPVKERGYVQSEDRSVKHFKEILEKNRIQVTVRREMGRDIQAACGQLRKGYTERSVEGCNPTV